jgi:uncharacterized protein (DUF2062 family)
MKTATRENFFRRKLINPVLDLLKAGITPEKLSITIALASVIGVIPAIGVATILGTLIATRFKLNAPVMLLISYFMNPLQVLIAFPLIKLGIYLFGGAKLHYTFDQMLALVKKDWLTALDKLWVANLLGVAAWALLAVPAIVAIYYAMLPLFRKVVRAQATPA